jgi:N-acetylmuramate 1-kinase
LRDRACREAPDGSAPAAGDDRSRLIGRFLAEAGWPEAETRPLAGDASFRRYSRIRRNGARAILMDAPPGREDVRPFVRVARHLHALGLSAPAILAADETNGLLLLEDFGEDTFTRLLSAGSDEAALYRMAVDVLVYLHRLPTTRTLACELPGYDLRRLLEEALLLTDWYLPAIFEQPTAESIRAGCIAAWETVLAPLTRLPPTLVLRDFHVDNLMRLPDRPGLAACGLLDFQDAVAGPTAYDLMSLLEDARRDVSPAVKAAMLARYREGIGDSLDGRGWQEFESTFAILAAQRHAKVIGIFTRLSRRDGKPVYLRHIPRVWRMLEGALRHPALAPVAAWMQRRVPPADRVIPLHPGSRP